MLKILRVSSDNGTLNFVQVYHFYYFLIVISAYDKDATEFFFFFWGGGGGGGVGVGKCVFACCGVIC